MMKNQNIKKIMLNIFWHLNFNLSFSVIYIYFTKHIQTISLAFPIEVSDKEQFIENSLAQKCH